MVTKALPKLAHLHKVRTFGSVSAAQTEEGCWRITPSYSTKSGEYRQREMYDEEAKKTEQGEGYSCSSHIDCQPECNDRHCLCLDCSTPPAFTTGLVGSHCKWL